MRQKIIYLDNASTTKPDKDGIEVALSVINENYANPSSLHFMGISANKNVEASREKIGALLNCPPDWVYFTSGGTEANNMVISGVYNGSRSSGFITNKAEHPSVSEVYSRLEEKGTAVDFVSIKNGQVDITELLNLINENTALVSVMHVNNETGEIHDINEIGKLIKQKNKKTMFHADCVQSFGKHQISMENVDAITISAHKIHGLKGTGAAVIKRGTKLTPLFYGGHQQMKMRPGTENTPGIAAFGVCAEKMYGDMASHYTYVKELKDVFLNGISDLEIHVNGKNTTPYILNVSFIGVKAEVMVSALSSKGICASTGASCHAGANKKNILEHYGYSKEITESAVRFSFSHENTLEEIYECIKVLKKQINFLRKFGK